MPGGTSASEGERPSTDAVALRWLTIGGLTIVAGWFLLGFLRVDAPATNRWLAIAAILAALFGDLLQVPQQALASETLSVGDTGQLARDMPVAWYVRLGLELAVAGVVVLVGRRAAQGRSSLPGISLTGLAVLTLTFTSHSAGDENRAAAMLVNAAHLESVAFWLGGVAHIAVASIAGATLDRGGLRQFSRLAVVLAPLALLTGFVNAGLLLPTVESAWSSVYGQTLLLKLAFVLGVLGLAWFNRSRVRQGITHLRGFVRSLRAEAVFGAGSLLIASVLALSALPSPPEEHPLHLRVQVDDERFAHFEMGQPDTGANEANVWLSNDDNEPISNVGGVEGQLSMIRQAEQQAVDAEQQDDGRWLISDARLETEGWWQATLQFERDGVTTEAEFVFLLPDPVFVGADFEREPDPDAAEIYSTGLSRLLDLESMRAVQSLSDGAGNSVTTEYRHQAPNRLHYETSSDTESIAIGDTQYLRKRGEEEWTPRERVRPYSFPDVYSFYYSGAQEVSLEREITIDGTSYQIISFYVPEATGRAEAWYLWWVNEETGMVRREAMIADHHYMRNEFADFDEPVEIEQPDVDTAQD